MKDYVILPQAPLVIRSGRPFGEGSRDGANFPLPSALAGLMRTQVMDVHQWSLPLRADQQKQLEGISMVGPFLAQRKIPGKIWVPWLPKPADALLLLDKNTGKKRYFRLVPKQRMEGTGDDLPLGLWPVTLHEDNKGKPQKGSEYWPLEQFLQWRRGDEVECWDLLDTPGTDSRTHVALDRKTLAADGGRLFQTDGVDYGRVRDKSRRQHFVDHEWGLFCRFAETVQEQMVTLGGERRLSWLGHAGESTLKPDDRYLSVLGDSCRAFSLTVVTPALFDSGWKPGWLGEDLVGEVPDVPGLKVKLCAVAVERWQSVSGWDLRNNQPRAARKAVAVGAIYWFEIIGEPPVEWANLLWFSPISDQEKDRSDGFGVVVPGPWSLLDQ